LLEQYQYLPDRYGIVIESLPSKEQDFALLKQIIENVKKIANEKQQTMLQMIGGFIDKVESNLI
jgi:hypothetical protein